MTEFEFAGIFDEDYLYFYADRLAPERSDREAETVAGLVGLKQGMRVLDVPCGHGRIANRLAALGAEVVGVDAQPGFLERARRSAADGGLDVDYRTGDMRRLEEIVDERFDAVVNWFTSFGYFDDPTNRAMLAAFNRLLRPGGRLVLEMINRDRILRLQRPDEPAPTFVLERGDDLMIDRWHTDATGTRCETERIIVRDARVRRARFTLRLFTAPELTGWLHDAGFDSVEVYDGDANPFTWPADRLMVLATTPT